MSDEIIVPPLKALTVRKGVTLTAVMLPVIAGLDPLFFKRNLVGTRITSGLRLPQQQLDLLRSLAAQYGLAKKFPNMNLYELHKRTFYEGESVFEWQLLWSTLLGEGVIVNPPLDAKCLLDYFVEGVNRRGKVIPSTSHSKGTAFDIGGATGKPTIDDELAPVEEAYDGSLVPGLASYKVERKNNCIHINCKP
jgi:hypothetical protein